MSLFHIYSRPVFPPCVLPSVVICFHVFTVSFLGLYITCITAYHVHQSENRLSSVFPYLSDSPLWLPVFPRATLSTRAPRLTAKLSGSLTSPPILDISTRDFRPALNLTVRQ
jgi:hypothetical protein